MATTEARIATLPVWGLGATIHVSAAGSAEVIGHDGRNYPAINTAARLHLETGDGIVVLATGTEDLASDVADAWVYWRTGRISLTSLPRISRFAMVAWLIGIATLFVFAALKRFVRHAP
mgnify:CR=1 FL=1